MRLVRNFLFLTGGEVASKLLTLVAIGYVARVAGPAGFGYLEFASSVVLLVGLLVHQGYGLYGAREIARRPESTGRLVSEIVSIRLLLAGLAFSALAALVYTLDRPEIVEQLILLYGVSLLLMPLGLQWVFQGHEQMRTVAALQILRQVVFAAFVVAVVSDRAPLWPVPVAEIAAVAALAAGSLLLYRRRFGEPVRPTWRLSRGVVRDGTTIGLSRIFWSARMYGAIAVMGLIASEQDVGYFGAAMRILLSVYILVWLYYVNLLPSLSRGWKEDDGAFERLMDRSMHSIGWLGLGGGLVWVILAPWVIRLAYGNAFDPAVPILQWLGVGCVVATIHGHWRFGLISSHRQKDEMMTAALGAVVSLALIPVGYERLGPRGAALAVVAGELAVWLGARIAGQRRLRLTGSARHLVRPGLSAVAVFTVVTWLAPAERFAPLAALVAVVGLAAAAYATDQRVRAGARHFASAWRASR